MNPMVHVITVVVLRRRLEWWGPCVWLGKEGAPNLHTNFVGLGGRMVGPLTGYHNVPSLFDCDLICLCV